MIDTKKDILTEAFSIALEKMAFLTILPLDEKLAVPQKRVLAEIDFSGPETGIIQILTSMDLCKLLAENMGAQIDDQLCFDAIKEIANVTCGMLLPSISSSHENFDVSVPRVAYDDNAPAWNKFTSDENCITLNVDGFQTGIKLILNNSKIRN